MTNVKVIYGAPLSGKTTYVKDHVGSNDIIYDFDDLMRSLSGLPYQTANQYLVDYIMDIRKVIIKRLHKEENINNAFIITSFIGSDLKQLFKGLEVEYIKMDTSIKECLERLNRSERADKDSVKKVIKEWFLKYDKVPGVDAEYKTKEQKKKFYNSAAWKKLRLVALKRDNYECQECKREGLFKKGQNVHHIKEIYHHPEAALELDNLETVCIDCHNKEHDRIFNNNFQKKVDWKDEKW